jgi:hypothetical protein
MAKNLVCVIIHIKQSIQTADRSLMYLQPRLHRQLNSDFNDTAESERIDR